MTTIDLSSNDGKEFLRQQYCEANKSTHQIAQEIGSYANKVRRALKKHGLPLRDKAEAQKTGIQSGRCKHPTQGKKRDRVTKEKIGTKVHLKWNSLSKEEKVARSEIGKQQWKQMSVAAKDNLQRAAARAIRRTSEEGSQLEKFFCEQLQQNGFSIEFHKEFLTTRETTHVDIFIPELKTCIEIDGPSHFSPIWGYEALRRTQKTDSTKTGLLLEKGLVLIRVKYLIRTISEVYKRTIFAKLLEVLSKIKQNFPADKDRLIILE